MTKMQLYIALAIIILGNNPSKGTTTTTQRPPTTSTTTPITTTLTATKPPPPSTMTSQLLTTGRGGATSTHHSVKNETEDSGLHSNQSGRWQFAQETFYGSVMGSGAAGLLVGVAVTTLVCLCQRRRGKKYDMKRTANTNEYGQTLTRDIQHSKPRNKRESDLYSEITDSQKVKISHARPIKQNQRQREDDVIYNHLFERGVAAEQEEYYDHALPVHNGLNIDPEYYGTVVIERDNCVEDPATHGQSQTFHIVDNRIEETNMLENNAYFILENEGQWGPY
ncbi:uncharacterized protein LOC125654920 [Ostrea edulis]|uniref:uncharacterized protein LOC125654920 n=1 Tax=Ostrea edulis TaxID=37623 RepID=UPI0024AEF9D7|nr:uncharacterized protein LOC125654920 [Ostrea edulis]